MFLNILFKKVLKKKTNTKIFTLFYNNISLYYPSSEHTYIYNTKILGNFNNLLLKDIWARKKRTIKKFLKKTIKLKTQKKIKKLKLYYIYLKILIKKAKYKFNKSKLNMNYIKKINKYKELINNIKKGKKQFFKLILICLVFKKYKTIKNLKKKNAI